MDKLEIFIMQSCTGGVALFVLLVLFIGLLMTLGRSGSVQQSSKQSRSTDWRYGQGNIPQEPMADTNFVQSHMSGPDATSWQVPKGLVFPFMLEKDENLHWWDLPASVTEDSDTWQQDASGTWWKTSNTNSGSNDENIYTKGTGGKNGKIDDQGYSGTYKDYNPDDDPNFWRWGPPWGKL